MRLAEAEQSRDCNDCSQSQAEFAVSMLSGGLVQILQCLAQSGASSLISINLTNIGRLQSLTLAKALWGSTHQSKI